MSRNAQWRLSTRGKCLSTLQSQLLQLTELREQLQKERSENVALESRVRDEVTNEFSEFFSEMQTDYKWALLGHFVLSHNFCLAALNNNSLDLYIAFLSTEVLKALHSKGDLKVNIFIT